MSLKYALLGFLNYGPHTGYELKKVFDVSVAHFWNAELSQIYPTLKNLETEGLVEMKVDVQADRPNRKVYTITDDGRRELLEWLATPADAEQFREPLLIKVFFASTMSKQELIRVLSHRAEELRRSVAAFEDGCTIIEGFASAVGLQREAFFWDLTVDSGIKHNQASLEWIEGAIRRIEEMDDSEFGTRYAETAPVDAKVSVDTLQKLKAKVPNVFALAHNTGAPCDVV
jgi:DNA-binding PadR family transcriptional regulator